MKGVLRNVTLALITGCLSFEIMGMRQSKRSNRIQNSSNLDGNVTINGQSLRDFLVDNQEAIIPVGGHIGNHYCKLDGIPFGGDRSLQRERVAVKDEDAAYAHQRALILWALALGITTTSSVSGDEVTVIVTPQTLRPNDEGIYGGDKPATNKKVTGFKFKVGTGGTGFSHFEPLIQ